MRREEDIRRMVLDMGIGEATATLAIPYMFFLPRTTDPAAQGVQVIVRGLQKGLQRIGSPVQPTGFLGPNTARAVRLVSGDGWFDKTWAQIYGDVLEAQKIGYRIPLVAIPYTGATPTAGIVDFATSPLGLAALAVGGYLWFKRKKR